MLLLAALGGVAAPLAGQVVPDTARSTVLLAGRPAGLHRAWTAPDGARMFDFQFNDRGRGPSLTQRVVLGRDAVPERIEIKGHDYLKSPVDERFVMDRRKLRWRARWKSSAESSSVSIPHPTYFAAINDVSTDVLERLLVESAGKPVSILPQGRLRAERVRDVSVTSSGRTLLVTLWATHGLGFTPQKWWTDDAGRFFASGSSWMMIVREGWESTQPALLQAQAAYDSARAATLARTLARRPTVPVVFRDAMLFDAESARMIEHTSVVVSGNRITAVGPNDRVTAPEGAEIIDLAGRTLMPGMWDMHVHTSDDDGVLHLAAGVTTVRDLANDMAETLARRRRIDAGTLLGPRMLLAGFLDGPGPFAAPTRALVSTADSARAWVNRYADSGYVQIKVYSSLDTALVPVIVRAAHARGLRVSGHVPQGMTAEGFVRAGADELQHVNFLFLNFWKDSVKDTRTPERFTAPGQRAVHLDLDSERVRRFVALLKERGTVVDPTLVTFEAMYTGSPAAIDPAFAAVADRLPPAVRRGLFGGALPMADSATAERYRGSYGAMKRMVKVLHDAGVPLVAGTDAMAGFAYHRELELYGEAGIPSAQVLRIATLGAARVMKRDADLGSIAPGKLADLVVIGGDPVARLSDVRKVTLVLKDGVMYVPATLYREVGVTPVVLK
jgi:imidazolonepropionase-like amidohydrolase